MYSYGLLNRCLVVEADIKELRSYLRLREDHIHSSSMHINHMQKALTQMNIRLKEVLSQLHGKSGIAIIEAILNGERDREVLVGLCHINRIGKSGQGQNTDQKRKPISIKSRRLIILDLIC